MFIRHGHSAWNLSNRFTGWTDIPLTEVGLAEAAESLRDCQRRVLPYWEEVLRPRIAAGRRVLVASHGNTLRSLIILKTSVERVRRPDQAGVWREATTPQGRSLQGGATSPKGTGQHVVLVPSAARDGPQDHKAGA